MTDITLAGPDALRLGVGVPLGPSPTTTASPDTGLSCLMAIVQFHGANRIVVMDRGQIVEMGTHADLLRKPSGAYAALHRLQQA